MAGKPAPHTPRLRDDRASGPWSTCREHKADGIIVLVAPGRDCAVCACVCDTASLPNDRSAVATCRQHKGDGIIVILMPGTDCAVCACSCGSDGAERKAD